MPDVRADFGEYRVAGAAPHGHGILALGVTGASFIAARPGTALITSTRLVCPTPPPNSGSQSGTVECGAILGFRVSVRVS